MHIDLEWPRILTPGYWFAKARLPQRIESLAIRNIIKREDGEPDWLVAVLVIDNADIDEEDPEYLDLHQLRLSLASSGTFFPWTCSCGAPGCAGLFRGVVVSHNGDKTIWRDLDGDRHFEFNTAMLRSAFEDAMLNGARILATTPGLEVTPDQTLTSTEQKSDNQSLRDEEING